MTTLQMLKNLQNSTKCYLVQYQRYRIKRMSKLKI